MLLQKQNILLGAWKFLGMVMQLTLLILPKTAGHAILRISSMTLFDCG